MCPVVRCRCRFQTERQTLDHIDIEHSDLDVDSPTILPKEFRIFDTTELRKQRRTAERIWNAKFDNEDDKQGHIDAMYGAYHSETARAFFEGKGVLNQGKVHCVGLSESNISLVIQALSEASARNTCSSRLERWYSVHQLSIRGSAML